MHVTYLGGKVPLGVVVAEVEALQQAATRLAATTKSFNAQLEQLDERANFEGMPPRRAAAVASEIRNLTKFRDRAMASATHLEDRFINMRSNGVQKFTPLLLQTVVKYNHAFETTPSMLDGFGENILREISVLCGTIKTKGNSLRQPLPSAEPPRALITLMLLMERALSASVVLKHLVTSAIKGRADCEIYDASKPIKGIARSLQKSLEEYDGDYTRLLDLARSSIVCDTLQSVRDVLAWLLDPARSPRFRCCRIKDRLSRDWDAEMSGGNRDIMMNGWLELGAGVTMIVEVQIHLRCLFMLKSDLHVLYSGVRVLGAMDDSTAVHKGAVDDDLIEKARQGVVRKMHTSFSPCTREHADHLSDMLKQEPCALLELDLSFASLKGKNDGFLEGRTISQVLVPSTNALACRRLRVLFLGATGLKGPIPDAIHQCSELKALNLGFNDLTGPVPAFLTKMKYLCDLRLHMNALTGQIPSDINALFGLHTLKLNDNLLTGTIPYKQLSQLKHLKILWLKTSVDFTMDEWKDSPSQLAYLKEHGHDIIGNVNLKTDPDAMSELKLALPTCDIH